MVFCQVFLKLSEVSAIAGGYGDTLEEHTEHCKRTLARSGRRRNKPCAFPFRFKGKVYDGVCTNIGVSVLYYINIYFTADEIISYTN